MPAQTPLPAPNGMSGTPSAQPQRTRFATSLVDVGQAIAAGRCSAGWPALTARCSRGQRSRAYATRSASSSLARSAGKARERAPRRVVIVDRSLAVVVGRADDLEPSVAPAKPCVLRVGG